MFFPIKAKRKGFTMKLTAFITFFALIFITSCGSENADFDLAVHPVDVWLPFVQVTPPSSVWETRQSLAVENPNYDRLFECRWQQLFYEELEAFNFLFPNEPHIFIAGAHTLSGSARGLLGTYHYSAVLIIHVNEEEASRYLAYIEDFETIKVYFIPRSFNELEEIVNQINISNVYPKRWLTSRNIFEGFVLVKLFNYSEEEKAFFREHVLDSPYIRFVDFF